MGLKDQQSLTSKTLHGVSWSVIDSIASQGVTFLVGIILARLLSPAEFGLIGIITIFLSVFNTIIDSGFSNALIRDKKVSDLDYNTVFIFNLILSVVLFIVFFFSSSYIARFFNQKSLILLIKSISVVIIINALAIVQRTRLVKSIDFKTLTKVSLLSVLPSAIIGVGMAFYGFGVWALIAQVISKQLLNTIFLWSYNKWIPSLKFSFQSFKRLFDFGWKLLVSQLLSTIWNEMNQIIIGRCYNVQVLGQYTRAHQFSSIFSSNFTTIIQRVTYPVLSSIQDESARLKQAYRKIIKITMYLSLIFMLGLAAVAKPLILVLVGSKWLFAAEMLPIICFNMMFYSVRALNTNMLQVSGRSDQLLILEIIKKIIALVPFVLGVLFDVYWLLWGNVVTGFIGFLLNAHFSGKFIHYTIKEQLKDMLPSFMVASFMAVSVYMLSFIPLMPILLLIIQIVAGVFIIVGLSWSFKLSEFMLLLDLIRSRR